MTNCRPQRLVAVVLPWPEEALPGPRRSLIQFSSLLERSPLASCASGRKDGSPRPPAGRLFTRTARRIISHISGASTASLFFYSLRATRRGPDDETVLTETRRPLHELFDCFCFSCCFSALYLSLSSSIRASSKSGIRLDKQTFVFPAFFVRRKNRSCPSALSIRRTANLRLVCPRVRYGTAVLLFGGVWRDKTPSYEPRARCASEQGEQRPQRIPSINREGLQRRKGLALWLSISPFHLSSAGQRR